MQQPVKQTGAILLLQLVISSSLIGVTLAKPPSGFEPWSQAWEVDDKPTDISSVYKERDVGCSIKHLCLGGRGSVGRQKPNAAHIKNILMLYWWNYIFLRLCRYNGHFDRINIPEYYFHALGHLYLVIVILEGIVMGNFRFQTAPRTSSTVIVEIYLKMYMECLSQHRIILIWYAEWSESIS